MGDSKYFFHDFYYMYGFKDWETYSHVRQEFRDSGNYPILVPRDNAYDWWNNHSWIGDWGTQCTSADGYPYVRWTM